MLTVIRVEAKRLYEKNFPNRRIPNRRFFGSVDHRLREFENFRIHSGDKGRPRSVLTPQMEENILNSVYQDPSTSTRRISSTLRIHNSQVWNILHDQQLQFYHVHRVYNLLPNDLQLRLEYCEWFLQQCAITPHFTSLVLFTDETGFNRNGITNFLC